MLVLATAVLLLLTLSAVRHQISDDDRAALRTVLGPEMDHINLADSSYEAQIAFLSRMQELSHQAMGRSNPMDFDIHRSASSVLEFGGGWCYDYSYWYEEAMRVAGLKTRHVALYQDLGGFFKTLSTSQGLSHAATEVKTAKGWLLVEPSMNKLWLDKQGQPISVGQIRESAEAGEVDLLESDLTILYPLYANKFFYIYGLYSRHGRFFKPFNPVPDIHYGEFLHNL